MVRPSLLRPGDTVSIVAPSKKIAAPEVRAAIEQLSGWGLKVQLGKYLLSDSHSYFSATDDLRLFDLQDALDDESTRAIFCARGGYGLTRILDRIQWDGFIKNPKWIIGFSDITALHLKLFSMGVESMHGIMSLLFSHSEATTSLQSLQQFLFAGQKIANYQFESVANKPGIARGRLIGGNLSLLTDAIGTSADADYSGCILMVEEVDEPLYKIDRMFTHLWRSGKLTQLAGLIVGHITDVKDTTPPFGQSVQQMILEKIASLAYPVAFNFPSGHTFPNFTWRHGAEVTLQVTDNSSTILFD